MAEKPDEGAIRRHIREARMIIEGEDQPPRYVARLQLGRARGDSASQPYQVAFRGHQARRMPGGKGRET